MGSPTPRSRTTRRWSSPEQPSRAFLTPELPGIGGTIKESPSDFVVEETPLYEPCGEGPHLYVSVTREGLSTQDVRRALAGAFGVAPDVVGYAGLKDKHARCTQAFSVLTDLAPSEGLKRVEDLEGVEATAEPVRHRNKLKPGHLLGNRFRIRLRGLNVESEVALARAVAISQACEPTGWPNYFGEQRQGAGGANASKGRAILEGRMRAPRKPWLRKLLLSAWQSERFDAWLSSRITAERFDNLLSGDIAKKTDTGGLFDVEDPEGELPRLRSHAIVFTGPMFGFRMRSPAPGSEAAEAEAASLATAEISEGALKKARLTGARRPARLHPEDLAIEVDPEDPASLVFRFALRKGAYATTVLREYRKPGEAVRGAA